MENFKADKFCVLSLLSVLFSIFQKISIKNTVRLIESTDYAQPKNTDITQFTLLMWGRDYYI